MNIQDLNPELIRRKVAAIKAEFPEIVEDELWFLDTLEGETNVFELLNDLVNGCRNDETIATAITERMKALEARRHRYEQRQQVRRKLMHQLMEAADLRRADTPEATLSIRPGPLRTVVLDESMIPEQYWRVKREPNLSQIKQDIKAGTDVPGVTLSNGADIVAIRTR